jgi:eukaryotic-like serine/threonine-protein kinase
MLRGFTVNVRLVVTAGPHAGREFVFDRHDTFLVGRVSDAHLQFSYDDPYFSRRHFLVEFNPPRCRVLDLNSRNGVFVNGRRVHEAELHDGDELRAGHTVFRVHAPIDPQHQATFAIPDADSPDGSPTIDFVADPDGPLGPVPGYTLGSEIGRGGMGVVYRGQRDDGLAVAVKVIRPSVGVKRGMVERFLREAQLLASLNHRHILKYIDSGTVGGMIYLVTEFVDGQDAGRLLAEKGPLPTDAAVRLVCQVLDALAYAHKAGVVHRDVKPPNVLLGGPPGKRTAKLADFGLARAYDDCQLSGLTMQGEVGGTPAFMAPEQATHYRDVKPAADQYSAAAMLYNLLTAKYPHDLPKNMGAQLSKIITEPPVPLTERRPDVPAGLAEVVHRGMAFEPDQRFADVLAFRKALLPFARRANDR